MIYLASDHAGFKLKEKIKQFLQEKNHEVEDLGPDSYDPRDDYPDFIYPAAKKVSENPDSLAIVIGGDGQGEAIVANKVKGVRSVVFYGPVRPKEKVDITGSESLDPFEILKLTRGHNNANVLSLGARFLTEDEALKAVDVWLSTKFTNEERHARRINKINEIDHNH